MQRCFLVVDDDALFVELARLVLQPEDITVIGAPDGSAALALLDTHRPTMIISDIDMPVMDGFSLYEQLRGSDERSSIPFVFISGTEDPAVIDRVRSLRGPRLLRKADMVAELATLARQA
jgi:CheY-like chemotaxis protein